MSPKRSDQLGLGESSANQSGGVRSTSTHFPAGPSFPLDGHGDLATIPQDLTLLGHDFFRSTHIGAAPGMGVGAANEIFTWSLPFFSDRETDGIATRHSGGAHDEGRGGGEVLAMTFARALEKIRSGAAGHRC